jgi:hypothetical protein
MEKFSVMRFMICALLCICFSVRTVYADVAPLPVVDEISLWPFVLGGLVVIVSGYLLIRYFRRKR